MQRAPQADVGLARYRLHHFKNASRSAPRWTGKSMMAEDSGEIMILFLVALPHFAPAKVPASSTVDPFHD
jgi:hypothetical protein